MTYIYIYELYRHRGVYIGTIAARVRCRCINAFYSSRPIPIPTYQYATAGHCERYKNIMSRVRVWSPHGIRSVDSPRSAAVRLFSLLYRFQTGFRRDGKKRKNYTVPVELREPSAHDSAFDVCARSLEADPLQETSRRSGTKIPRRCRRSQLPPPPPFSRARTHSRDQWSVVIILAKFLLFPCADIDIFFFHFYYSSLVHLTHRCGACRIAPECHFRVVLWASGKKKKTLGVLRPMYIAIINNNTLLSPLCY